MSSWSMMVRNRLGFRVVIGEKHEDLGRRARENPLSLLLIAGGAGPTLGVDTVYDGSAVGVWMDESYKYSIGTGMGFDAWKMHPWYNLAN